MSDDDKSSSSFGTAAYGGDNWSPRLDTHQQELGKLWANCGIDSEWRALKSVLLHCPDKELNAAGDDPDAVQMLDVIDLMWLDEKTAMIGRGLRTNDAAIKQIGSLLGGLGIECLTSPTDELSRAAGNIGCLTAVLWRECLQVANER
ncbi:MAG: hypothetical protein DRR15_13490 [Gammaproteobacteria bacterium]|nr:MAG: hypothetical protein DRR15_13490 [Gammaproteobacteria bacterium]